MSRLLLVTHGIFQRKSPECCTMSFRTKSMYQGPGKAGRAHRFFWHVHMPNGENCSHVVV